MCPRHIIATCGLVAALAAPSFAVDGVNEINQAAVFAGGITPGDAAGFPVTLSQVGSYRLTGNLDVTKMQNGNPQPNSENVTAIKVTADDVSIDLNGFAIIGPVSCDGNPTTCTPSGGTGQAIDEAVLDGNGRVTIRNGTIRGMGSHGIVATGMTTIEEIRLIQNGGAGILINRGVVRGCVAEQNGDRGIQANDAVVVNNVSRLNGGNGINAQGSTVIANTIVRNFGEGILGTNSVVLDNHATANMGVALSGNVSTGYGNNVFNGNNSGGAQVSAGPLQIGTNVCQLDTICP